MTVAYDGRPFSGWGKQPNGNTVQDHLEKALSEVAKQEIRVHGSGRTDAGVHALGQVLHFDAPNTLNMNPFNWVPAVNTKLPATIRALSCEEIDRDFHARFSAVGKTYTYDLCLAPVLPPLKAGLAWHLPRQLDGAALDQALELFLGEHDFRAFAALRGNETAETSYRRRLSCCDLVTTDDGYRITYTGNGFLYKMVRLLTGAAVHVAQGRLRLDELQKMLESPTEPPCGKSPFCAPPDGLILDHVSYS